jgi:pimeloyl-ACP methyl ester carboxylesterase
MPTLELKPRALFSAVLAAAVLSTSLAAAQSSQVCFDVSLRGGASEVCASVSTNPAALPVGATILAVHGFTETAATWEPLTAAMFADPLLRRIVKRVVAIDLPGHGASEAPTGLPGGLFGDLTINDNVSVVIQSIDILRARGLGARVIMGHSMGGLAIQGVQEALLTANSSLAAHGVFGAILIASVPGAGLPWTQLRPPSDLTPFVQFTPALGTYLDIPPPLVKLGGGYTTLAGTLTPDAPSDAQMFDYVGWEPITTALQLTGQIPLPRPGARQGAFALNKGTVLAVISFSQDVLTPAVDQDDLYLHLNGRQGLLYRPVVAPNAVHNMHISNPAGVLTQLRNLNMF